MSWEEKDSDGKVVEKMEISNDAPDERPDASEGWRYAGSNSVGEVYVRDK